MADPLVLRALELKTHTLLRLRDAQDLRGEGPLPAWVERSLQRASWVVVRRALGRNGLIPIGVRGEFREQRFAAWVAEDAILDYVAPGELVRRRAWEGCDRARLEAIPALAVLDELVAILDAHGLSGVWGPGGSVGFELASGAATATPDSDLDLVIAIGGLESSFSRDARELWRALAGLRVRVDALLETSHGAVVLSEYVRAHDERGAFVLRTTSGPRLIHATFDLAATPEPVAL